MVINFLIRTVRIICLIMILFFVLYDYSYSSSVWIEGTITCREQGKIELERPAKCIIVMPKNTPEAAVITQDNGFYAINLPIKDVIDKRLTLSFFSKSGLIDEKTKYVWYDEIKGKKRTFKFATVCLKKECELVEDEGRCHQTQAHLEILRLRAEKPKKGSLWPSFLGILGAAALAGGGAEAGDAPAGNGPGPGPITEISDIRYITPRKIEDGKFLSYAFSAMPQNIGFLISPTRNIGDAVFFNTSAIAMSSYGQLNASYGNFFNSHRYSQAGLALPFKGEFGLGLGFLFLHQEETRTAFTESNESLSDSFDTGELAIFLSGSKRLRNNLSIGLTAKYLSQSIEGPEKIMITTYSSGVRTKSFIVSKAEESFIDYDLSMTLKNTSSIQTGLSLMNIKGTKVLANDGKREKIRAVGIGASYKKKRMHLGSDVKLSENGDFDISAGINFVPFTNAKVSFGLGSAFDTLILGAEYMYFTYTFNRNEVFDTTHFIGLKIDF